MSRTECICRVPGVHPAHVRGEVHREGAVHRHSHVRVFPQGLGGLVHALTCAQGHRASDLNAGWSGAIQQAVRGVGGWWGG